jgi:hypothetical protein
MNKEKTNKHTTDFHGAALIDEDGNEIPITEDMVQNACHNLEEDELEKAVNSNPGQKKQ